MPHRSSIICTIMRADSTRTAVMFMNVVLMGKLSRTHYFYKTEEAVGTHILPPPSCKNNVCVIIFKTEEAVGTHILLSVKR